MMRKGPLRRRLRALEKRNQESRRDLGVLVLEMYRSGQLEEDKLRGEAAELEELERELDEVRAELEGGSAAVAVKPADEDLAEAAPRPAAGPEEGELEELAVRVEDAEQRVGAAAETARRETGEEATAEILALEEDLQRERQRAADALEQLRRQLQRAEQRATEAEEARRRGESEARAAAAQWLRGQAEAMRQEAARQVREELAAEAAPAAGEPGPDLSTRLEDEREQIRREAESSIRSELEAARAEAVRQAQAEAEQRVSALEVAKAQIEEALAEMTRRSNEANARAQQAEAARQAAEEELRAREEELLQERRAPAAAAPEPPPPLAAASTVSLNAATFEQLRELGMSVIQANRVIAYRERLGGYKTVDDIDAVPGFHRVFLNEVKAKLKV